ncbi:hypothetical protein LP420_31120 [Massilia sp. B-10]|nr:hypothetical protein LP420_31120 [Massilia sp. B-10]
MAEGLFHDPVAAAPACSPRWPVSPAACCCCCPFTSCALGADDVKLMAMTGAFLGPGPGCG